MRREAHRLVPVRPPLHGRTDRSQFDRQILTIAKAFKMKPYSCSVLLFLVVLSNCVENKSSDAEQTRPNILLIVADDLGFTDLGCYGGEIRTPNLDALASVGIRNTDFYTAPTCSPTRAMLLSGVDNHRNGYGTMEGNWGENQKGLRGYEGHLNFDVVTFPKLLQDHGYHTSIAGKWHLAYPVTEKKLWPDKRGFDRSFCLMQGGACHFDDQPAIFSFYGKSMYTKDGAIVEDLPKDSYSSDFYTKKVIEFIDESQKLNKPFFTFLSFTAPHWPLQVPDGYLQLYEGQYDQGYEVLAQNRLERSKQLGLIPRNTILPDLTPNVLPWDELSQIEQKRSSRIMEVYASMIERLDANVGKLIAHLKATGQYENTLIVFMADNGAEGNWISGIADTEEWIHDNFDNSLKNIGRRSSYVFTGPGWAQVSTVPFKWYKTFSTEGGVRCPSIVSYPKWNHNNGKINGDFLSVMDLAPTFLELAGVEHPGREYRGRKIYPMDGISMVSWLNGDANRVHPADKASCWELFGRRGVRKGNWKAVWQDKPYGREAWELYNLEDDPGELHDLADSLPDKLEEMTAEWERYALKYQVTLPDEKVAYSANEIWREGR